MKNIFLITLVFSFLFQSCTTNSSQNENQLIAKANDENVEIESPNTEIAEPKKDDVQDRLTPPSFESRLLWHPKGEKHNYSSPDYNRIFINPYLGFVTFDSSFKQAFEHPLETKNLYVKAKGLSSLPDDIIKLQNLERLTIVGANLINFSKDIEKLAQLPNLKALDLTGCNLLSLPKNINLLQQVEAIYLGFNNLKLLPEEICELKNLAYLNLYNNRPFIKLPNSLGKLKSLEALLIAGTKVSTFPESIGDCDKLLHITANACRLEKLPDSFGDMENLMDFNFGSNNLKELPKTFGNLPRLRIAHLSNNKLKSLPANFGKLDNLLTSNFDGNLFTEFPMQLLELKNYLGMNFVQNNIKYIPLQVTEMKYMDQIIFDSVDIRQTNLDSIAILNSNIKLWKQ